MSKRIMRDGHDRKNRLAYLKQYYRKRRDALIEQMGGKCVVCGAAEGLELDHIDPSSKSFGVSEAWGARKQSEEAAKCQLLCKPCHQVKTALDRSHKIKKPDLAAHAEKWWGGRDSNPQPTA